MGRALQLLYYLVTSDLYKDTPVPQGCGYRYSCTTHWPLTSRTHPHSKTVTEQCAPPNKKRSGKPTFELTTSILQGPMRLWNYFTLSYLSIVTCVWLPVYVPDVRSRERVHMSSTTISGYNQKENGEYTRGSRDDRKNDRWLHNWLTNSLQVYALLFGWVCHKMFFF